MLYNERSFNILDGTTNSYKLRLWRQLHNEFQCATVHFSCPRVIEFIFPVKIEVLP